MKQCEQRCCATSVSTSSCMLLLGCGVELDKLILKLHDGVELVDKFVLNIGVKLDKSWLNSSAIGVLVVVGSLFARFGAQWTIHMCNKGSSDK